MGLIGSESLTSYKSPGIRPLRTSIAEAPDTPNTEQAPSNVAGILKFGNLSKMLGGGQYNIGQTPDTDIKDARTFDFNIRNKIRGGYSGKDVGIDHIVPIALGGTNDLTNVQLLPKDEFDHKTTYDNLAAAMFRTGHITLAQARNFDKNWNNNPTSILTPDQIKNVLADPKVPETYTDENGKEYRLKDALRNPEIVAPVTVGGVLKDAVSNFGTYLGNSIFNAFSGLVGGVNKVVGAPLYAIGNKIKTNGESSFTQDIKDYVKQADNGQQYASNPAEGVGMQLPKSFVKGITGGWVSPDNYQPKNDAEKIAGTVLGGVGYGLGMAEALGGLTKLASGAVNTIPKAAQTIDYLTNTSVIKAATSVPLVKSALTSAGLFAAYGQLGKQNPGQFLDLHARADRLMSDIINGGVYSITGDLINEGMPAVKNGQYSLRNISVGTLANAFTGYVSSKMEGASDEDALMNAGVFGVLHAQGLYGQRFELEAQRDLQTNAINIFRGFGVDGKMNSRASLDRALVQATSNINQSITEGHITADEGAQHMQQLLPAYKALKTSMMPLTERVKEQIRDIASTYISSRQTDNLKKKSEMAAAAVSKSKSETQALNNAVNIPANPTINTETSEPTPAPAPTPIETPQSEYEWDNLFEEPQNQVLGKTANNLNDIKADIEGRFQATGVSDQLQPSPIANANQKMVIKALQDNTQPVYIALEREPNHPKDPKAVKITAQIGNSKPLDIGYVPSEGRITNPDTGLNARWTDRPDRLFNPKTNNITFAERMDDLGLPKVSGVKVSSSGISKVSNQPWMIFTVPNDSWNKSLEEANKLKDVQSQQQPIGYNARNQYYDELLKTKGSQENIMANTYFNKIDSYIRNNDAVGLAKFINEGGKIISTDMMNYLKYNLNNFNYSHLYQFLSYAELTDNLNQNGKGDLAIIKKSLEDLHNRFGDDAVANLFSTPISKQVVMTEMPESTPQVATSNAVDSTVVSEPSTYPVTETKEGSVISEPEQPADKTIVTPPINLAEDTTPKDLISVSQEQAVVKSTPLNLELEKIISRGKQDTGAAQDYSQYTDGVLSAFAKRIDNKIIDLYEGGKTEDIKKLQDFKEDLSREAMSKQVKRSSDYKEFTNYYLNKAKELGVDLFDDAQGKLRTEEWFRNSPEFNLYSKYNYDQLQTFKHRYLALRDKPEQPTKVLTLVPNPEGGFKVKYSKDENGNKRIATLEEQHDPESLLQQSVRTKNTQYGDATMALVKVDEAAIKGLKSTYMDAQTKVQKYAEAMRQHNVFIISDQNADPANTQGIYLSPSTQKEFKKIFNENESDYRSMFNSEMIENMKKYLPDKDTITDDMKTMMVFYKKVLNLDNPTADTVAKRINLIDNHGFKWNEKGDVDVLLLPTTSLTDSIIDMIPQDIPPQQYETLKQQVKDKITEDGAAFMMPDDMHNMYFSIGATGEHKNAKGVISINTPEGIVAIKSNTGTLDASLRQHFEQKYNIKIQPGQMISFVDNVKMGKEELKKEKSKIFKSHPDNPNIKVLSIPKTDLRFGFESPHDDQAGTFSFGNLGSFSVTDRVNYNGQNIPIQNDLVNLFKPAVQKFVDTINKINDAENATDALKIFGEAYGKSTEAYGQMKTMIERNADMISLKKTLEKENLIPAFQQTVMRNRDMDSAYLKILPDMGFYDPFSNNYRMLKHGEIMISREHWQEMGKPEYLMAMRYPISGKLAMSKQKILVAEDYGITDLGKDNSIMSHYDVMIEAQGDYDGDGITVVKVIPKTQADQLISQGKPLNGIPETVADHVEQERKNYIINHGLEPNAEMVKVGGKEILLSEAKYPKLPAASMDGTLYVLTRAAEAKQQLGGISNMKNLARMLYDNMMDTNSKNKHIFTDIKGNFYAPDFNMDKDFAIGTMLQTAVDGSSKDLFSKMNDFEKNPLAILLNISESTPNAKGSLIDIKKNIDNSYMGALKPAKEKYESIKEMMEKRILPFLNTVPDDPRYRHPMQEIMMPLKDLKYVDYNLKQEYDSDLAAAKNVITAFEKPKSTKNSQDFIKFYKQKQQEKADIDKERYNLDKVKKTQTDEYLDVLDRLNAAKKTSIITDYYNENKANYTEDDIKAISYFLATAEQGNWYYNPNFAAYNKTNNKGSFVDRFHSLITPEHDIAYFKARQQWINDNKVKPVEPKSAETPVAPAPQGGPKDYFVKPKNHPLANFKGLEASMNEVKRKPNLAWHNLKKL